MPFRRCDYRIMYVSWSLVVFNIWMFGLLAINSNDYSGDWGIDNQLDSSKNPNEVHSNPPLKLPKHIEPFL